MANVMQSKKFVDQFRAGKSESAGISKEKSEQG